MTWREVLKEDSWSGGWYIEVSSKKEAIDLSPYEFVWEETPPYLCEKSEGRSSQVGLGPEAWKLTPEQEPLLGRKNGAMRDNPPMVYIAKYLEILVQQGFKISGSHCALLETQDKVWMDAARDQTPIFSWTLVN